MESIRENYKIYEIRARRGHRRRRIEEPLPELKAEQRELIDFFEEFQLHPACMARHGKNIAQNAAIHEGAKYVLKVDIKGCYANTTYEKVWRAVDLWTVGHNLHQWKDALSHCFIEDNNGQRILPTGAPTSPILCNIALTPLDYAIDKLTVYIDYAYSRYMDDIHLSTKKDKRYWGLLNEVREVVEEYGYTLNNKKTKWLTCKSDKVIVTGVRLGNCSKVPREFRRMLRAKIQNLAREGKQLDPETQGCLAYVKSIDEEKYHQMLSYYERRLAYEARPHNQ